MRMPAWRAGQYRHHAEGTQETLITRLSSIKLIEPSGAVLTECLGYVAHASPIKGYSTGRKTMNSGHSHPHCDVLIALSSTTGLRNLIRLGDSRIKPGQTAGHEFWDS
jgi:hypothetical protein